MPSRGGADGCVTNGFLGRLTRCPVVAGKGGGAHASVAARGTAKGRNDLAHAWGTDVRPSRGDQGLWKNEDMSVHEPRPRADHRRLEILGEGHTVADDRGLERHDWALPFCIVLFPLAAPAFCVLVC